MRLKSFMSAKIHNATVTRSDLHYVGSITIDTALLELTGMQKMNASSWSITLLAHDLKPILLRVSVTVALLK